MKKKLPIFQVIAVIVLAGMVLVLNRTSEVIATHQYVVSKYYRFEALREEEIEQYFSPKYEKLESIEFFIANVYPETRGRVCLTIYDERGKRIFQRKYKAASIPTGEFQKYKINKKVEPGKQYCISLSYDGDSEEKPQLMVSEGNRNLIETGTMYVEGTASEYSIAVTYHYSGSTY